MSARPTSDFDVVSIQPVNRGEQAPHEPADPTTPDGSETEQAHPELTRLSKEVSHLHAHIFMLEKRLRDQKKRIAETEALRASLAWRIGVRLENGVRRAAPSDTRRGRAVHIGAQALRTVRRGGIAGLVRHTQIWREYRAKGTRHPQAEYRDWLKRHSPRSSDLRQMSATSKGWASKPLISIILPVYNPEIEWLEAAIKSVADQVYTNWELCIADDLSVDPEVRKTIERWLSADSRIKAVFRDENGGISRASNSAIELATGEFMALLDHDDLLRPHALFRVVELLQTEPELDLIYTDEDKILVDGGYGDPHFKPTWSPELLLSLNYVCHLSVLRSSLVHEIGGFREGFEGSQDHDLILRFTEHTDHIGKIDDVLYAWRVVEGSTALSLEAKPEAVERSRRAVEESLERRGRKGGVVNARTHGYLTVRYDLVEQPEIAIVIPTRDRLELLRQCIENIESKSTYKNYTITLIDNDSAEPETLSFFKDTKYDVVKAPGPFNYAHIINIGIRHTSAPFVLQLNNDVTVMTPDWLEAMLEHAQHPEVGAVGARLVFPEGNPQHEGIAVGAGPEKVSPAGNLNHPWLVTREVSAVTGACLLIRREIFDQVGGFDESLLVAYNDVDFCLRVHEAGYTNIYTPCAELIHQESSSRGSLHPTLDEQRFRERWGADEVPKDPYLNPHLIWPWPMRFRD
jgi:O-antigen biosynthesis protein